MFSQLKSTAMFSGGILLVVLWIAIGGSLAIAIAVGLSLLSNVFYDAGLWYLGAPLRVIVWVMVLTMAATVVFAVIAGLLAAVSMIESLFGRNSD